jgi:hypothetical protein
MGAVLLEANDERATQTRYMQVEPIAELPPSVINGEITPDDAPRITPRAA